MSTDNETNSDVAGSRRRTIDTDDVSVSFPKCFNFYNLNNFFRILDHSTSDKRMTVIRMTATLKRMIRQMVSHFFLITYFVSRDDFNFYKPKKVFLSEI